MKDGAYIGKGKQFFRRDGLWYPSFGGKPLVLSDADMVRLYKVTLKGAQVSLESRGFAE